MKRYRSIRLDSDIDENAEIDAEDLLGEDLLADGADVETAETEAEAVATETEEAAEAEETVTEE